MNLKDGNSWNNKGNILNFLDKYHGFSYSLFDFIL